MGSTREEHIENERKEVLTYLGGRSTKKEPVSLASLNQELRKALPWFCSCQTDSRCFVVCSTHASSLAHQLRRLLPDRNP